MVPRFQYIVRRSLAPTIIIVLILLSGCPGRERVEQTANSAPVTLTIPATNNVRVPDTGNVQPETPVDPADVDLRPLQTLVEQLPTPVTLDERFSYTYGYLLMMTAMRDVQEIDPVYFARGAYDAGTRHTPLIPENMMNSVLFEFQDKLITEAARRLEELAAKNLEDAESFLAVNGKRDGVFTTPSGLQYEVIKEAQGLQPRANDSVRVHYRLTYLDGREGDASIRGIPSLFDLRSMIPGFREGLMLMPVGSSYRFYVHPALGYGVEGSTRIEPNTLLIFEVELVEVIN